jgi:hypothetical protein
MSYHWAIVRRELPKKAQCCKPMTDRHRYWAGTELQSTRVIVQKTYNKRTLRCAWCGKIITAIGIMIVQSFPPLAYFTGSQVTYVSVDILEIDEGEYDATKPPPDIPDEIYSPPAGSPCSSHWAIYAQTM